jgi:stringent starvation protein B
MHQWITDCGLTPQVIVSADVKGTEVPRAHVRDGKIVLNVSYSATRHLELGNEWLEFGARFSGVPHQVRVPLPAVLAVYARETGEGMVFDDGDGDGSEAAPATPAADAERPEPPPDAPPRGPPRLRVVK